MAQPGVVKLARHKGGHLVTSRMTWGLQPRDAKGYRGQVFAPPLTPGPAFAKMSQHISNSPQQGFYAMHVVGCKHPGQRAVGSGRIFQELVFKLFKVGHLGIGNMIFEKYANLPDYPFENYFESMSQYISAQQYWLRVLRAAEGFNEVDWKPVIKPANIEDDMYTGLLVDIESINLRKSIKLHANSISGSTNLILKEGLETKKLMSNPRQEDILGLEIYDSYERLLKEGTMQEPITTVEEAKAESTRAISKTGGFQAGVDRRDFYVEAMENSPEGPYVYGEVFSIVSTISAENERKALQALKLFLQDGSAMERVNRVFLPGNV